MATAAVSVAPEGRREKRIRQWGAVALAAVLMASYNSLPWSAGLVPLPRCYIADANFRALGTPNWPVSVPDRDRGANKGSSGGKNGGGHDLFFYHTAMTVEDS